MYLTGSTCYAVDWRLAVIGGLTDAFLDGTIHQNKVSRRRPKPTNDVSATTPFYCAFSGREAGKQPVPECVAALRVRVFFWSAAMETNTDLGLRPIPSNQPDEVTAENTEVWRKGKGKGCFIRLKSIGLTWCSDWSTRMDMQGLIEKHATRVLWEDDAESEGAFVGSFHGGPIREVCYEIEGLMRYCYILHLVDIDDWGQECWTSDRRLTAQAAADCIEAARKIGRGPVNKTEGDNVLDQMTGE
jgi:hypothetical protein